MKIRSLFLVFILSAICLAGVSQSTDTSAQLPASPSASDLSTRGGDSADKPLKIILLAPSIRFGDAAAVSSSWLGSGFRGAHQGTPTGDSDQYAKVMLDAARTGIGIKASIVDLEKLDPAADEVCRNLNTLASRLSRGNLNDDASKLLASLSEIDLQYAVLAQSIRVEAGVGATWNPNTGGISSSTASTLLQTALISAKTGKVIWKSEQLIRYKAARPADNSMGKALAALFKDFNVEGREAK